MKKLCLFLFVIMLAPKAWAQSTSTPVGTAINTDGTDPDQSAILDVKSANQGILIPRMDSTSRKAISNPANGLMIYQTQDPKGIYTFQDNNWVRASSQWRNYLGRTNSIFFNEVNARVGIGLDNPSTDLDVAGAARIGAAGFGSGASPAPANGLLVYGKVGIGTSLTNQCQLTIGGAGAIAAIGVGNNHYFMASNYSGIYENFLTPRSSSNQTILTFGTGGFNVQNNQSTSGLFINNSGLIGVNNLFPVSRLDVTGDINFTTKVKFGAKDVIYGDLNNVSGNFSVLQNMSSLGNGMWLNYNSAGGANAHLRLYAGSSTSRLFINATNGNIGVGTETPDALLQVNGLGHVNALAINRSGVIGSNTLSVQGSGDIGALAIGIANGSTLNGNKLSVNGGVDFSGLALFGNDVQVTGNVGIGTATPACALDVFTGTSQVRITGAASGQGESSINSYPLSISGAAQGMSIKVNTGSLNSSNNFISFSDNTGIRGCIEGNTLNEAQQDPMYIIQTLSDAVDLAFYLASVVCDNIGIDDFDESVVEAVQAGFTAANLAATQALTTRDFGVSYSSGGADYAEWLRRNDVNEEIKIAEIVGVKNGLISKVTSDAQQCMVISSNPAVIGNMPSNGEEKSYERVAFMGQVLTRVKGKVNTGDYILASGNNDGLGIAKSVNAMLPEDYLKVVGTAWSASIMEDPKLINVLVGSSNTLMTAKLAAQAKELDEVKSRLDDLEAYVHKKFDDSPVTNNSGTTTVASSALSSAPQVKQGNPNLTPEVIAKLDAVDPASVYQSMKKSMMDNPDLMKYIMKVVNYHFKSVGLDPEKNPKVKEMITPEFIYKNLDKLSGK